MFSVSASRYQSLYLRFRAATPKSHRVEKPNVAWREFDGREGIIGANWVASPRQDLRRAATKVSDNAVNSGPVVLRS